MSIWNASSENEEWLFEKSAQWGLDASKHQVVGTHTLGFPLIGTTKTAIKGILITMKMSYKSAS